MTTDKSITANFVRSKYTLIVGQVGEGTITETIISSDKNSEEYNSGTVVRLNATPQTGWVFKSWSGSSTSTSNPVNITIDGTKTVTATFEEQITQVTTAGIFAGIGKWEFRDLSQSSSSDKSVTCEISSIIFRTNGSFTIGFLSTTISAGSTVTGQYSVDSDTTISLTIAETAFSTGTSSITTGTSSSSTNQIPFGSISNLVLTKSLMNFSIQLNSGCSGDLEADKDGFYEEEKDTYLPPVITLTGAASITISVGASFTDPGATASDNIDGNLTSSITTSGTVNTSVGGNYSITYSVSDTAGNSATVTRYITVVPPKIYFENGICKCPNATEGDTQVISGTTYTAVGTSTLSTQIFNGNINLCTTQISFMGSLFNNNTSFNTDIGFWDTENVTNMDSMFNGATSFNQDLSSWCVTNISSEPTSFATSALITSNKPVWGTCPSN